MTKAITMIIDVQVHASMSAASYGLAFVTSPSLGVIEVVARREVSSTPLQMLLDACTQRLAELLRVWSRTLPERRVLAFFATPFWEHHNALSRRRGIWGSRSMAWLPVDTPRSVSVTIAGHRGARFAGIAEIDEAGLPGCADCIRAQGSGFLLFSSDAGINDARVRALFEEAFPSGGSAVEWSNLLKKTEGRDDVAIRVYGGFDDPEVSIEAFLAANLLTLLELP